MATTDAVAHEHDDTPAPVTTKGKPPGAAFQSWFASMKSGTAKELTALAAALPGVRYARVLEDPTPKAVVVLADLDGETSPQVVADCVAARAAAGAVVEVVRVDVSQFATTP